MATKKAASKEAAQGGLRLLFAFDVNRLYVFDFIILLATAKRFSSTALRMTCERSETGLFACSDARSFSALCSPHPR